MNVTGKSHHPYDEEFKNQTVEMLIESGRPLKVVARDLGVSSSTLRKWKKRYLGEVADQPEGRKYTPDVLAAENQRLREENEYLKRQRDILKKACGILSNEPHRGMP